MKIKVINIDKLFLIIVSERYKLIYRLLPFNFFRFISVIIASVYYLFRNQEVKNKMKLFIDKKDYINLNKYAFLYFYEKLEYFFTTAFIIYNPAFLNTHFKNIRFKDTESLEKALDSNKSFAFFTGHFSNFLIFLKGFSDYMRENNKKKIVVNFLRLNINSILSERLKSLGNNNVEYRFFNLTDENDMQYFISIIGKEHFCLINDVIFNYDSYLVPFSDYLTFTNLGIITKIIRTKTDILPIICFKSKDLMVGQWFELISVNTQKNNIEGIISVGGKLNQIYVDQIKRFPYQWHQLEEMTNHIINQSTQDTGSRLTILSKFRKFINIENEKLFALNNMIYQLVKSIYSNKNNNDILINSIEVFYTICRKKP